jgi:predicted nucleotidyltransferase component of viral defense system
MDLTRSVEPFHLLFLAQLARRLKPPLFVLKGGCNLRLFHRSVRLSEDLDLDLGAVGAAVFRDKVREVLASRPFAQILEARQIAVERVSEPKQTETTQRWKIGLRVEGVAATLPTKIECSRRGLEDGVVLASVDPLVAASYRLPPFLISHYDAASALRQKIGALAGRRETQARDVFDLHHLLASGATLRDRPRPAAGVADRARANALSVDFDTFRSQVLSYIEPEARAHYDSPSAWDTLVLEVVERLRQEAP